MGHITTHVLDTARGCPAAGVPLALYRIANAQRQLLAETRTNADGRCDAPVLPPESFAAGLYELVFDAGRYLAASNQPADFLSEVAVRFAVKEDSHYHVPLLLSPFGYSTYRGS